jgi:Family of unknown function (DUF5681)
VQNGMTKHAGQWKPGQSGNLDGRPVGTRNKFSQDFYRDLAAAWQKHGTSAMEHTAALEPAKFLAICASLIPKDVQVSLSARLPGGLESDDWEIMIGVCRAIKESLPEASGRKPAEVMQFVSEAIRAHSSKLIES